jgi:hypothetical protein
MTDFRRFTNIIRQSAYNTLMSHDDGQWLDAFDARMRADAAFSDDIRGFSAMFMPLDSVHADPTEPGRHCLTDDELDDAIDGQLADTPKKHLHHCAFCQFALARFKVGIALGLETAVEMAHRTAPLTTATWLANAIKQFNLEARKIIVTAHDLAAAASFCIELAGGVQYRAVAGSDGAQGEIIGKSDVLPPEVSVTIHQDKLTLSAGSPQPLDRLLLISAAGQILETLRDGNRLNATLPADFHGGDVVPVLKREALKLANQELENPAGTDADKSAAAAVLQALHALGYVGALASLQHFAQHGPSQHVRALCQAMVQASGKAKTAGTDKPT